MISNKREQKIMLKIVILNTLKKNISNKCEQNIMLKI